jgi:t-SNARE complex subunit (syntaxin)
MCQPNFGFSALSNHKQPTRGFNTLGCYFVVIIIIIIIIIIVVVTNLLTYLLTYLLT